MAISHRITWKSAESSGMKRASYVILNYQYGGEANVVSNSQVDLSNLYLAFHLISILRYGQRYAEIPSGGRIS